jgi:hypothetical protein
VERFTVIAFISVKNHLRQMSRHERVERKDDERQEGERRSDSQKESGWGEGDNL